MKTACDVARDLIPLVIDEVASEASSTLVREHIAECVPCKDYYDGMQAGLARREEIQAAQEIEQKDFDQAAKQLRGRRKRRLLRGLLLGMLLGVLIAGGVLGWNYLASPERLVDCAPNEYTVILSELFDGRVVVSIDSLGVNTWRTVRFEEAYRDTHDLYIIAQHQLIQRDMGLPMPTRCVRILRGEEVLGFQTIVQGTPTAPGAFVLWQTGDTFPAASEEMEEYFALEAQIHQNYPDIDETGVPFPGTDAMRQRYDELCAQLRAIEKTVPEWQ